MTEPAVSLVYRPDDAVLGPADRLAHLGGSPAGGPPRRLRRMRRARGYLLLAIGVVVGAWLVLVFGRALAELDAASARAAELRAENAAIEQRLVDAREEIELAQTDAFMAMQARAFGMGRPGERPFGLAPGAPSPPPVVPLGGEKASREATSPLEAWLRLLFGD